MVMPRNVGMIKRKRLMKYAVNDYLAQQKFKYYRISLSVFFQGERMSPSSPLLTSLFCNGYSFFMIRTNPGTPTSELQSRISKLQTCLESESIDAALILQNTDLLYFAGTIQQSYLYIPSDGEPMLMARKHPARARAESGKANIVSAAGFHGKRQMLKRNGFPLPRRLGVEGDVLPANLYLALQKLFPGTALDDISRPIRLIRAVKSAYELDQIQEAARFADRIADAAKHMIREGMTEIELAGKIEAESRKLGHQGIVRMRLWGGEMFYGHLMAGPSAAVPSYVASPTGGSGVNNAVAQGPGFREIKRREPILLDYVFVYNGYLADHTRIFAIERLADKFLTAHSAMLDIQDTIKNEAKPGVTSATLYATALKQATALGYEDYFMGFGPERVRFVGHGIGLELDEYPFLAKGQELALQSGMVVALEPKLIFPGEGVVGIENTHVVTDTGLKQLTHYPDEIVIL